MHITMKILLVSILAGFLNQVFADLYIFIFVAVKCIYQISKLSTARINFLKTHPNFFPTEKPTFISFFKKENLSSTRLGIGWIFLKYGQENELSNFKHYESRLKFILGKRTDPSLTV